MMWRMIKNSLSYMNSCRCISAGIILVLSIIMILQTFISEKVFEQGRYVLASAIAIKVKNSDSDVYVEDYINLGDLIKHDYQSFDVMATNYLDYSYNGWFGSGEKIAIVSYYIDCSMVSNQAFISDKILTKIDNYNTISMSDTLYYSLINRDDYVEDNDEIIWIHEDQTYNIKFSYGANIDIGLLSDTDGAMIASASTYKNVIGNNPIDDLYICSAGNIKLLSLVKLIYNLKFNEGYELEFIISPYVAECLKEMVRYNLIILLGIINMMQIVFFVFNGRKKEFDIMLLCGSTYKEIILNRFINLCLFVIPAVVLGNLIFDLLSRCILTLDYKFYEINNWQRMVNNVLFIVFQIIAYVIYEGKARNRTL